MFLTTVAFVMLSFEMFKYVHGQATTGFGTKLFKKKLATTCGTLRLESGWYESSQISCAVSCTKRYPETCRSFMYNKITKLCTPGSSVSTAQQPPSSNEGELYVVDGCGIYPEFSNHSFGNMTTFAAYFSISVNYTLAAATCRCLESHLFVAKTQEKYALFLHLAPEYTWMGLDDIEVEGQFVWADDHQQIDPLTMQALSFRPDNAAGRQDCARGFGPQLDDDYCDLNYHFICEKTKTPC